MESQSLPIPKIFEHEQFGQIRGVIIDDEPWLVGIDVARALGYQNGSRDINRHVDPEDRREYRFGTPYGVSNFIVINESGLFSLILRSNLPKAREFKRWITHEVLPSLRKYGYYALPAQNKVNNPYLTEEKMAAFSRMVKAFENHERLGYELQTNNKEYDEVQAKWMKLRHERNVLREKIKENAIEVESAIKEFFALLEVE